MNEEKMLNKINISQLSGDVFTATGLRSADVEHLKQFFRINSITQIVIDIIY
jgi:hypothetical protein